jgi:hypothetical protein
LGQSSRLPVRTFYRDHLVGKFFPPDVKMAGVSRTVGDTQVVEELAISFTHTNAIVCCGVDRRNQPYDKSVRIQQRPSSHAALL